MLSAARFDCTGMFAASLSVTMRENLVMILIALGQAHGSQFAPLVMRARGSVVCVGVRDAEKGPRTKCPPRARWNGASGVDERFREPPIEWPRHLVLCSLSSRSRC